MISPHQGDIIYINFDPALGHEIKKRRPSLVVSKTEFNRLTGFCLVCPITSTHRAFGTYIQINNPQKIKGDVVTHQLRSIDFNRRLPEFVEHCDDTTFARVLAVLDQFI